MSIFEERNAVFTLLVVINQGHASLAEDAHPSFFKWASSVHRWAALDIPKVELNRRPDEVALIVWQFGSDPFELPQVLARKNLLFQQLTAKHVAGLGSWQ